MSISVGQLGRSLRSKLPHLVISDGAIEFLKWLALVAMTLDHINKIIYKSQLPFMSEFGRIALPLFGMVIAYNLARPAALQKNIHLQAMVRMAIFGIVATPFYFWGFEKSSIIPLNILFTLMVVTGIIYLNEKGGFYRELLAISLFILGGIFVEYFWFGLGYCLAAWYCCKYRNVKWLLVWIASALSLYFVNDNYWALAAIPIIFIATRIDFKLPRLRLVFYFYYPLHLIVLWGIKTF